MVKRLFRRLFGKPAAAPAMDQVFGRIFQENRWGDAESRSGEGSNLAQTERLRALLPGLLAEFEVRSMLDIPCGDWNWMRHVPLALDYTGGDVVPELIAANQARFGAPDRHFRVMDITRDKLPPVDLVFCRDLLVHLSFSDIAAALANIRASGARWLLATTFPERGPNQDIPTGQWRPLNLTLPPIGLPAPLRLINEGCTEWDGAWADKSLGLWPVSAIPA